MAGKKKKEKKKVVIVMYNNFGVEKIWKISASYTHNYSLVP